MWIENWGLLEIGYLPNSEYLLLNWEGSLLFSSCLWLYNYLDNIKAANKLKAISAGIAGYMLLTGHGSAMSRFSM